MASFMQAMKARAERKDTNVNPPEAAKVLEEKSAPEVANTQPAASAAAPEPSATSAEAPAVSSDAGAASSEAPKAKRGRPAGSKNAPKPPAGAPASEATSPAAPSGDLEAEARELLSRPGVDGHAWALDTRVIVEALFVRGYGVTRL